MILQRKIIRICGDSESSEILEKSKIPNSPGTLMILLRKTLRLCGNSENSEILGRSDDSESLQILMALLGNILYSEHSEILQKS